MRWSCQPLRCSLAAAAVPQVADLGSAARHRGRTPSMLGRGASAPAIHIRCSRPLGTSNPPVSGSGGRRLRRREPIGPAGRHGDERAAAAAWVVLPHSRRVPPRRCVQADFPGHARATDALKSVSKGMPVIHAEEVRRCGRTASRPHSASCCETAAGPPRMRGRPGRSDQGCPPARNAFRPRLLRSGWARSGRTPGAFR